MATSIIRTSSTQVCRGALVGLGLALGLGIPTAAGVVGGAAIAGMASELSRKCLGGRKHQWDLRVEQLSPTDKTSDRDARQPLPKSQSLLSLEQRFPDLFSVSFKCTEMRFPTDSSSIDLKKIQANVVHLGQKHLTEEARNDPRALAEVWNYNRRIMEYLLEHSEAEVFFESLTQTSEDPQRLPPRGIARVKKVFPNGLPSDLNLLTYEQRVFIMETRAPIVLHYLGKIKALRRATSSNDRSLNKAILQEIARAPRDEQGNPLLTPALQSMAYDQREAELLEEIKQFIFTAGDRDREIVIVMGASHNLAKYFDPKKFQAINCLTAIQSSQTV